MPAWVALLVGLLAFLGAISGHYVAFEFSAASRRREVRRAQAERFVEYISEDTIWMSALKDATLFGATLQANSPAPFDRAFAIYMLYFAREIPDSMEAFAAAHLAYRSAIMASYQKRVGTAYKEGKTLSQVAVTRADIDATNQLYPAYYKAHLDVIEAMSGIVQDAMPEESWIFRWFREKAAHVSRFASGSRNTHN